MDRNFFLCTTVFSLPYIHTIIKFLQLNYMVAILSLWWRFLKNFFNFFIYLLFFFLSFFPSLLAITTEDKDCKRKIAFQDFHFPHRNHIVVFPFPNVSINFNSSFLNFCISKSGNQLFFPSTIGLIMMRVRKLNYKYIILYPY